MKKLFSISLVIFLFLFSTISTSFAGSRHGYRSYITHSRSDYSHYGVPTNRHHSRPNCFRPYPGIGILRGAIIGSLLAEPLRPRAIYYSSPPYYTRSTYYSRSPQIIVRPEPMFIQQSPRSSNPHPELILRQVEITVKIVNIRSGPSLENEVITQAHHNEKVDVIEVAQDWLYIKTETGQYGWLMTQYTRETDHPMG